jgi:hypothetical protein
MDLAQEMGGCERYAYSTTSRLYIITPKATVGDARFTLVYIMTALYSVADTYLSI